MVVCVVDFYSFLKRPCVCECLSFCVQHPCELFANERWAPYSKHDWLCVCVRTMCSALAGQCSVQCRSEQRRPRPGQPQHPGNPCVFRSPGPYLMSLSKKKVALSRVFLSLSVSLSFSFCLSLFYSPSFSHAPPPSPGATLRMNGFQVFTQQLCLSLYISQDFIKKRMRTCWLLPSETTRGFRWTSDRKLENMLGDAVLIPASVTSNVHMSAFLETHKYVVISFCHKHNGCLSLKALESDSHTQPTTVFYSNVLLSLNLCKK